MKEFKGFEKIVGDHATSILRKGVLAPKLSKPRLRDAHFAWQDDLLRVDAREPKLVDGLDHFKQCGHLAYWLRRFSPLVEYRDVAKEFGEEGGLYQKEKDLRVIISRFGSEYLAFDLGFQICKYYQSERTDVESKAFDSNITPDFIEDVCHMLKFKHVSPHSLFLVYKAIFM